MRAVTAATGAPRVLISGAADYAMLDFVHKTLHSRGVNADVTVTDLCETPLALNRWYAERCSCRVTTVCCGRVALSSPPHVCGLPARTKLDSLLNKWRSSTQP